MLRLKFALRTTAVILVMLLPSVSPSLAQTVFQRTYGSTSDDVGYSVQQTSDSGYIITGRTYASGAGYNDVYLIKTNSLGDTLWTRIYGGPSEDVGLSVEQTSDGGYIITGYLTIERYYETSPFRTVKVRRNAAFSPRGEL